MERESITNDRFATGFTVYKYFSTFFFFVMNFMEFCNRNQKKKFAPIFLQPPFSEATIFAKF
jgi:hypothetical protein